jgi:hypothetical protein
VDVISGINDEILRYNALHVPKHPVRQATAAREVSDTAEAYSSFLTGNPIDARSEDLMGDFAQRRRMQQRLARTTTMGGDVFAAIPRFYSPAEYFEQSMIPYDINQDKHRFELYKWLDLFYRTHYLIPILVDIFTRFPLVGMHLHSPDAKLADFYSDLFLNDLKYEELLVGIGREYWTLGQSFPLASFNDSMGVWESEELLDPTLVEVEKLPIIGGEQFHVVPPDDLKQIVKNQRPERWWKLLNREYPEIIPYLLHDRKIPISNVLLKQIAFKVSERDLYGTPILLRSLRTLMHEEKLMASQDAIAERLYSPLILAKLGVQEMGQGRQPWIPGPQEIAAFRNDLDIALSSDFRLLVHHFGVDITSVFGREQMPRLDTDFDRVERRIMQTFGINPALLQGGQATVPYASSALQAEFMSQMLRTYQGYLKDFYVSRAKIVAESQEHYAYEKRGDTRIPIMEEVVTFDEEGNEVIEKRHKLMIPDMRMKVYDLRDEATQRQFMQSLKQQGVPIPDQWLAEGQDYVFKEALELQEEELIQKTVAQQEAKLKTYRILQARGLPVPPDLRSEVEGAQLGAQAPGESTELGVDAPNVGDQIVMPPPPEGGGIGPRSPQRGTFPEESTEQMGPQIPGVPGQPGALGIPGAPKPAIGPNPSGPPGRGAAGVEEESVQIFAANKSGKVISDERRNRNPKKLSYLTEDYDSAILEDSEDTIDQEKPS